ARVDLEQQLPLPYFFAFLEAHLDDLAVCACLHSDRRVCLDVADRLYPEGNKFLYDFLDGYRNGRRALGRLALVRAYRGSEVAEQPDGDAEHSQATEHHPAPARTLRRESRLHQ